MARGSRNGNQPRRVRTAEGELEIQVQQIRGAAVDAPIPQRTAILQKLVSEVRVESRRMIARIEAFPVHLRAVADRGSDSDPPHEPAG